jgi:hypothetical protein
MGEDIGRRGRGALSEGVASSARPRTNWDREAVAELRGAVHRGDGPAVVGALRERGLEEVLQMAGDGLLVTLSGRVSEAREPAARCAALLRERSNPGDAELADELEAALGSRARPDAPPARGRSRGALLDAGGRLPSRRRSD